MRVALASDHAGYLYKKGLALVLQEMGHEVVDLGTHSTESVDYPLYIQPAAEAVQKGECDRGIVLGGSGNGEAMVANRLAGIRCAVCWNEDSARLARAHNDANMISLGERMMGFETAREIVRIWLQTPFDGGRHQERIRQIDGVQEFTGPKR